MAQLSYDSLSLAKPPIDLKTLGSFSFLRNAQISGNGQFVAYLENRTKSDVYTHVISTGTSWIYMLPGEVNGYFSDDSKYFYYLKNDTLSFIELGTKKVKRIPGVKKIKKPTSSTNGNIGYTLYAEPQNLYLVNPVNKKIQKFWNVEELYVIRDGSNILIKNKQGLLLFNCELNKFISIWNSNEISFSLQGYYFLDSKQCQLTFAITNDLRQTSIWFYRQGMTVAKLRANDDAILNYRDFVIKGDPQFDKGGHWIFFQMKRKLRLLKPENNLSAVDIWSYKDSILQPEQMRKEGLIQGTTPLDIDSLRSFAGVVNIEVDNLLLLEDQNQILVTPPNTVTGNHVVVHDCYNLKEQWWPFPKDAGTKVLDLVSHEKKLLKTGYETVSFFSISPQGRFIVFWDKENANYFSYDIPNERLLNITNKVPVSLITDEILYVNKLPVTSVAGWTLDEKKLFVYDNYDCWEVDPEGIAAPKCVTDGFGLRNHIKLRFLEQENLKAGVKTIVSAFLVGLNELTKENSFFKLNIYSSPTLLSCGKYIAYRAESQVGTGRISDLKPVKARYDNKWILKLESPTEAPNYHVTSDFKFFKKLTNISPNNQFNWYTTELISWIMPNGQTVQGILYKPENFDTTKKYPLICNYYEKKSYDLFAFQYPQVSEANINVPYFVSNGYLVFQPDIYFSIAAKSDTVTGEHAFYCLQGGLKELSKRKYIDTAKIGIQGHSFGGLLTGYLISHSSNLAAAVEASGSTDPISAYLTLAPLTSPVEHYNKQTAIERWHELYGVTLWDRPDLFLRNSTVMNASNVNAPVLIMHNIKDNQVQWRQGVEFYMALRRLQKPCWMTQYDQGNHGVFNKDAIDYTIRLQQFFDHYLKSAPAPIWMTQGIPAKLKQVITGYDLDPSGNCGNDCKVCKMWNEKYKKDSVACWKEIERRKVEEHWMGGGE
jgi:dienelactone hydrolase